MTVMTKVKPALDEARMENFAERVCDILNDGAVGFMIFVGYRLRLFDAMSERGGSGTSREIAADAGLAERYVREWLCSLTVGGLIDYEPESGRFTLPPEHAAMLCRNGAGENLAVFSQHIPMVASIYETILEVFRTGEGISYENYPCFHEVMAEDSNMSVVSALFDNILPLLGEMQGRLEEGIDVFDAGCGRGQALMALAERYPASRFTGYDLCEDAIDFARFEVARRGLDNISFRVFDMTGFELEEKFDLITSFDAVHDQKDPQHYLKRIFRALRPGGLYLMQDIGGSARLENNHDFPMAAFLYTISCTHCTPVSRAQGGEGLGTMWGWETALDMLREAGFGKIEKNTLEHDPMNVWFISRKG
ncbi:class I SAM-dependent methyltransferase [Emcibacter sp.]|uniref:class I SAM-dependent methyltransferase n=1 Tax=Emcibacter sp. TaxID=1979954 RepID=UPI003A905FF0